MNSSSSSSSLFTLYASVLVPVYSEWISKVDLCFLDTAVCSQELRNRFLEMLTFCNITKLVSDDDISFSWVIKRSLRVSKLNVTRLIPVIKALIESSHLSCLHIDLNELAHHMSYILSKVHDIAIHWLHQFDASQLLIAGSAITELSNFNGDDESIRTIAACCPNLKRISAYCAVEPYFLPLVDACQLDEINNCHLGSLIKREKCEWNYTCNLKRTSEVDDDDETAVCLGEGKYYHMTSLNCWWNMTEEDSDLLLPLMPHLIDLSINHDFVFNILSAAIEKCHYLRMLQVDAVVDLCELRQLLLKSYSLRVVYVDTNDNLDECVAAMSENCSLLEVCWLQQGVIESESVMSQLFKKCHYLVEFTASHWPVNSLLPFVVNIDKLALKDTELVNKFGRGNRSLGIPSGVSTGVLCAVFAQNPGLRSVEISDKVENMPCVMASMVQSCPQLTSFDITALWLHNVDSLASLGHLQHLSSLTIRDLQGLTIEIFSAILVNKSSSLLLLSLRNCSISGDMLAVISRLCPTLTSLNLDDNPDIENADMMELLTCCSKLEVLSLWYCYRITSEILSIIQSPPMKSLNVFATRITRSDLTVAFDGFKGFKYRV